METRPPADARARQHIEVHVAELRQLFNNLDAAPDHSRDLDPDADAFIVEWANDLPRDTPLSLRVHADDASQYAQARDTLAESVRNYFTTRRASAQRGLRHLLRRGRISLCIGLGFLSSAILVSELLGKIADPGRIASVLQESLLIGGWVAMWRPLEILLYDWWPVRADIRLFDRLSRMPVDIRQTQALS